MGEAGLTVFVFLLQYGVASRTVKGAVGSPEFQQGAESAPGGRGLAAAPAAPSRPRHVQTAGPIRGR